MLSKLFDLGAQMIVSFGSFFRTLFIPLPDFLASIGLVLPEEVTFLDDITLAWLIVGAIGIYIGYALVKWVVDIVL